MAQDQNKDSRGRAIELHIDELVLHGFTNQDRYAIEKAVQTELGRLLAAQGRRNMLDELSNDAAHVDAGTFNVAPKSSSATLGNQIGQTVHRGLMK
jgi:hypothetical protein